MAEQRDARFAQLIEENVNGFNRYEYKNIMFSLPTRYNNVKYIHSGAEGDVFAVKDKVTGQKKAIKKIFRPFRTLDAAKHTYREIKIGQLVRHPNLIALENLCSPQNSLDSFDELYITMPFMELSLFDFIHERKERITHECLSKLMFKAFSGIAHLNQAEIMHRDLSPGNIGINLRSNGDHELKILDYGYARMRFNDKNTPCCATLWYQSPEVLLGSTTYSYKVDMWALGAVMTEIINGQVLLPGFDNVNQADCILNLLGRPNEDFWKLLPMEGVNFLRNKEGDFQQQSWEQVLTFDRITDSHNNAWNNHLARDLISKLVTYTNRLSVTEVLNHDYFAQCNQQSDILRTALGRYDFTRELEAHENNDEWRRMIYGEVQMYKESHDVFSINQCETSLNV